MDTKSGKLMEGETKKMILDKIKVLRTQYYKEAGSHLTSRKQTVWVAMSR